MPVDDGYGAMMQMPHGSMGLWMLAVILVVLAIGFGAGYIAGRSR